MTHYKNYINMKNRAPKPCECGNTSNVNGYCDGTHLKNK